MSLSPAVNIPCRRGLEVPSLLFAILIRKDGQDRVVLGLVLAFPPQAGVADFL